MLDINISIQQLIAPTFVLNFGKSTFCVDVLFLDFFSHTKVIGIENLIHKSFENIVI